MKKLIYKLTMPFRGLGLSKLPGVSLVGKYLHTNTPESLLLDGVPFYLDPNDSLGLSYATYEPDVVEVFKQYIKPDFTVVDVGANIGYYTVIASRLAKKVIAFEPEAANFELIKKNIEGMANIVAERMGLSDSSVARLLNLEAGNIGGHSMVNDFHEGSIPVETTTLDAYLNGERVDFIKMDIQGYEGIALGGMLGTLKRWKPIVVSEFRKIDMEKSGVDPDWFFKVFDDLGYGRTEIGKPIGKVTDKTTHNYLFLPAITSEKVPSGV